MSRKTGVLTRFKQGFYFRQPCNLEAAAISITPKKINKELRDYLGAEELAGLDRKITRGLRKIIESLP